MLPMNPVESLKCRYIKKNYFSTCQAMTNIFPWHCDAPGIVRWGTNSAWWLCDSSLPWSPAHTGKKGQNNREKSFWPLLWGEPWVSKTSQQFLYSSTGTSAHFKSVVLIVPHACVVREEDSPAWLRAALTLPRQGSSHPLDPESHTGSQMGIIWELWLHQGLQRHR